MRLCHGLGISEGGSQPRYLATKSLSNLWQERVIKHYLWCVTSKAKRTSSKCTARSGVSPALLYHQLRKKQLLFIYIMLGSWAADLKHSLTSGNPRPLSKQRTVETAEGHCQNYTVFLSHSNVMLLCGPSPVVIPRSSYMRRAGASLIKEWGYFLWWVNLRPVVVQINLDLL